MNILQKAGYALVGMAVFLGFVWLLSISIDRQAQIDCLKLQAQSEQFDARIFFITQWQKERCDAVGISINAQVK